ncbi:MAG: hypothetical protein KME40_29185 [Komarekiella atlantica HA4396-MV6]|jgi:hypothetical protein|nr:hypothetical protein [Komarekiella atlantica HA4396-MV6]
MPKVNISAYQKVEKIRWTKEYMDENLNNLKIIKIDDLTIADARSGIILEGLDLGTDGTAHINLTVPDGIEYLHLSIFDKKNTGQTKAAIYYQIASWDKDIKLTKVEKTYIDGKMTKITNSQYNQEPLLKQDLEKILTVLFEGCKSN